MIQTCISFHINFTTYLCSSSYYYILCEVVIIFYL